MSPTRQLLVATLIGSSSLLRAEDVAKDSTPPVTPAIPLAPDSQATPSPTAPSKNVTINLINRLVQKGILSEADAADLIKQAEADAIAAQSAVAHSEVTPPPPIESSGDETRVTYIPEVVKNNMRDEIKQDLMAQARKEKWSDDSAPEWTSKFRPFGDIRGRYERLFYPSGNDSSGAFTNFNSINNGSPYDSTASPFQYPPSYNTNQDRQRERLRLRLGTDIMLGEGFNGGIRFATGDSNSPISPNQTLGGSGGNFSKYQIWLDRAFLSYDAGPGDGEELTFLMGRFDNPFFSSEIMWDDDLGFDGLAVRGKVKMTDNLTTFFNGGYFPIYNTDLNFASNQPSKFSSTDKWLAGAQIGIDWKITDELTAKLGAGYYEFTNISGELSSPYTPLTANDAGDTDATRTGFSQRGNTYMPLRNIIPAADNGFGTKYQYQYYGLASEFRNLTLTGKLDYDHFDSIRLSLLGEFTKNVAFDAGSVASRAYSEGRPGRTLDHLNDFQGGDIAWLLAFQIGNPALEKFGDWQATFGYRYVESDAVVDGFTDSDFGGGGTNVKGFTLGGNFALTPATRVGIRWMSSDEVSGPPLASDTLQIDINAKF